MSTPICPRPAGRPRPRLWAVFGKSLREHWREPWLLALMILTAPVFVFLYWAWFGGGSTSYGVLVINQDRGVILADGSAYAAGPELAEALSGATYASGRPILAVRPAADRRAAEADLANRDAALLVIIPDGFSQALLSARQGPPAGPASPAAPAPVGSSQPGPSAPADPAKPAVVFVGDLGGAGYAVAAAIAGGVLDEFLQTATGRTPPVVLAEEPLGATGVRTEFEAYVPGLLVIAVIMLIFTAAMAAAREVEAGTLRRLRLTRMTSFDFLAGLSLTQTLIGVAAVLATFLTAWTLGFRSQGPLWVAVAVGGVTSLSVVGVGLIVAAFSRGATDAFIIGNFPLIFFLFFSGAVFPMPRVPLFTVAGHAFGLYDVIPATHAVVALNKVLALGAGLGEVAYELTALAVLSAVYFAAGVWLFGRRHLRDA